MDLPFYYWTVNERFQDLLPNFDQMPRDRVVRRPDEESEDEGNNDNVDYDSDDNSDNDSDNDSNDDDDNDDGDNNDGVDNNNRVNLDQLRNHPQRLQRLRVNRREDAAIFAVNRQYLPVRHFRSLRAQFNSATVDLPPPIDNI